MGGYSQDYFLEHRYGLDDRRAEMYKLERRRILSYKQGGCILDVGCGTGDFLRGFGDGWHKFGLEPSEYAAGQAIQKGLTMVREICDVKTMDVIVFRGTLQHIEDPFISIRKAVLALKQDGLLVFLATPDADSLCFRLFGDLPALDWPLNYWIPSQRTLVNVLEHLNMEVIRVEHPYLKSPYAHPLRDMAHFIGRLFGLRSKFPWPGNMMEVYSVHK